MQDEHTTLPRPASNSSRRCWSAACASSVKVAPLCANPSFWRNLASSYSSQAVGMAFSSAAWAVLSLTHDSGSVRFSQRPGLRSSRRATGTNCHWCTSSALTDFHLSKPARNFGFHCGDAARTGSIESNPDPLQGWRGPRRHVFGDLSNRVSGLEQ